MGWTYTLSRGVGGLQGDILFYQITSTLSSRVLSRFQMTLV